MEQHNGETSSTTLCRQGCGFYGSSAFEGMCSKCYKDVLKRRQQNSSPTPLTQMSSGTMTTGRASPVNTGSSIDLSVVKSSSSEAKAVSSMVMLGASTQGPATMDMSTTPSIDTATPTVPGPSLHDREDKEADKLHEASGGVDVETSSPCSSDNSADKDKRPKKNRCQTCKKKVGLTGFPCRCGGLFCSIHRYSDKHDCTFNYKELAQEQIRKNNPVIIGEKIQKI